MFIIINEKYCFQSVLTMAMYVENIYTCIWVYISWGHEKVRWMYFTWFKWPCVMMYSNKQNPLARTEQVWMGVIEMSLIYLSRFQRHWRHSSSVGCNSGDRGGGSNGFHFTWLSAGDLPRTLSCPPAICSSMSLLLLKPNSDLLHKFLDELAECEFKN